MLRGTDSITAPRRCAVGEELIFYGVPRDAVCYAAFFVYSRRMEFSTHSIATPESANTASHMEA